MVPHKTERGKAALKHLVTFEGKKEINGGFRSLRKGRIGFCTLKDVFHPKGRKNSSRGPKAQGMNFYFPRDEINSLKGATTQFFLTAGYENAFHTAILNSANFRKIV